MSNNTKIFINFERYEMDKKGKRIPIWRKREYALSKAEVVVAKANRENLKVNVQ